MDFECIDALLDLPEFRVTNQVIRPHELELHLEGCAQRSLVALTSPLELVSGLTAIAKMRPTSCWLAPPATLTSD